MWRSEVSFARERAWNGNGEVQARLTVDQTVSTVLMPVAKVSLVASSRVGKYKSDYLW